MPSGIYNRTDRNLKKLREICVKRRIAITKCFCEKCGKEFDKRRPDGVLRKKTRFCSVRCSIIGRKTSEETKEKLKKREIWNKGLKYKGKPCSDETKAKISSKLKGIPRPQQRGDKHGCWKGGVTSDNKLIRHSIEYRLWREAVFARDNWTCQDCGKRDGSEIHPHHIKQFAYYPELRFAIDNGMTLCKKCHKKQGIHERL